MCARVYVFVCACVCAYSVCPRALAHTCICAYVCLSESMGVCARIHAGSFATSFYKQVHIVGLRGMSPRQVAVFQDVDKAKRKERPL